MEFFTSWTFIILMAVLLVVLLVSAPILILMVIYLVARSGRKSDRRETGSERD